MNWNENGLMVIHQTTSVLAFIRESRLSAYLRIIVFNLVSNLITPERKRKPSQNYILLRIKCDIMVKNENIMNEYKRNVYDAYNIGFHVKRVFSPELSVAVKSFK